MLKAKVFKTGRSQAVRLPKECRFDTDEVYVQRIGSAVLLVPRDKAWELMKSTFGQVDDDFMKDRNQPERAEEREPL